MGSSKTVLVTGASGFIGANVARELLAVGANVRVLLRKTSNKSNLKGLEVEEFIGDLTDRKSLLSACIGCDEVYHVAAEYSFWSPNPKQIYESNVGGTDNILSAALEAKVSKVVYTSTVGTIGLSNQPGSGNESTPILSDQFGNAYKDSKFKAEKVAFDYVKKGLPLVVVNPSAPIGAWDLKPTPTGKIIVDFVNGKMPAYLNTGLNFVHVRDVAKGHLLAAEKGRIGERYILGNQNGNLSLQQFLGLLAERTGRVAPRYKIPYMAAYGVAWLSSKISDSITKRQPLVAIEAVKMAKYFMYFDTQKAIRELGLPQTPIEVAIDEATSWFAERGYFNKEVRVNQNGNSIQTSA